MSNIIVIGNPWHEFISDSEHCVDEVVDYDHKGQNYGYKVYTVTSDSDVDLPEEYVGSWKCPMIWGDMCGDIGKKDLIRVLPVEETVVKVTWEVA